MFCIGVNALIAELNERLNYMSFERDVKKNVKKKPGALAWLF
jgi:hypothetical protein